MNKSEYITQTENLLRKKREAASDKARANYERACMDAEFNKNEHDIRQQQFELGKAMYCGEKLKQEQTKLDGLYKKRLVLLTKLGMNKSDLIPKYECPVCKDTGNINGKRCKCFDNLLFALLSESSFVKDKIELEDVKSDSENSKKALEQIKKFEKELLPGGKKNLLLGGKTGTGKTFLLNALANTLMKKGMSVFFITAFNLNRLMLKIHVGPLAEKDQLMSSLLDADVLIIDDLGSEQIYKSVTIEYLFNIIDERQRADKHTLYSTNLSLDELQARYLDRIFSRLANKQNTLLLQLQDDDRRLKK